jgi:hypothetical protein
MQRLPCYKIPKLLPLKKMNVFSCIILFAKECCDATIYHFSVSIFKFHLLK